MIKLYQFATSPFTEKVARALNYKGLAFEPIEVARAKVPAGDYAHVSPTGKFPAIEDDGTAIWDSTDIIHHLDAKYPEKTATPADARDAALAHAIEEWADESLYFYEMTMRLAWEHNLEAGLEEFAKTMPGVPPEKLKPMIMNAVDKLTKAQGVGRKPQEQVVADVERHFGALDAMLEGREWLVGDCLSYADLAVISQVNALLYAVEAQQALTKTKNVQAWMGRVDQVAPK
jgi:glutathione S-transferase